ncbi:SdrH family protein, partial [Mammaliicoccus lentus]
EPSTEEPQNNGGNNNQTPPPNQSNKNDSSSEPPKSNESSNQSKSDNSKGNDIENSTPTMPSYPNTDEIGNYQQDGIQSSEHSPKFIPGNAEEYYNKMDKDVLDLVTSKVGTRPDLAEPKFKNHEKTTETTTVDNDQTTKKTTHDFENASDKKDITKQTILGISIAIVIVLGAIIVFIIRRLRRT